MVLSFTGFSCDSGGCWRSPLRVKDLSRFTCWVSSSMYLRDILFIIIFTVLFKSLHWIPFCIECWRFRLTLYILVQSVKQPVVYEEHMDYICPTTRYKVLKKRDLFYFPGSGILRMWDYYSLSIIYTFVYFIKFYYYQRYFLFYPGTPSTEPCRPRPRQDRDGSINFFRRNSSNVNSGLTTLSPSVLFESSFLQDSFPYSVRYQDSTLIETYRSSVIL